MEGKFQGSQFAAELQSLLGADADPDPLFLEESWTLGTAAAKENLERRRSGRGDRERQNGSFRELHNLGSVFFMPETDWSTESWLSAQTASIAGRYAGYMGVTLTDAVPAIAHPSNEQDAYAVLGVSEASSREQIKSAYRSLVGQWHPDRFEGRSDEARNRATESMAAINAAYRMVCAGLLQAA
jgi:DnaJ-domain-containing protein 1